MITPAYARTMARYNAWQNGSIYGAADGLSDEARRMDRGAFWGSIYGTLSHLLWGDTVWMSRFDGGAPPQAGIGDTAGWIADWDDLRQRRREMDGRIEAWTDGLAESDLTGDLTWWSGAMKREYSKPVALLVMQLFNHQTHHRGQVHAMLTAAGAKPDDTDIPFMPDT